MADHPAPRPLVIALVVTFCQPRPDVEDVAESEAVVVPSASGMDGEGGPQDLPRPVPFGRWAAFARFPRGISSWGVCSQIGGAMISGFGIVATGVELHWSSAAGRRGVFGSRAGSPSVASSLAPSGAAVPRIPPS